MCGAGLSESATKEPRAVEDAVDGRWQRTVWALNRRYCNGCDRQQTATPSDVLSGKKYGINIMSQVAVLHSAGISFGVIEDIIEMFYNKHIHRSVLEGMCKTVSDVCRPIYEGLCKSILDEDVIGGILTSSNTHDVVP